MPIISQKLFDAHYNVKNAWRWRSKLPQYDLSRAGQASISKPLLCLFKNSATSAPASPAPQFGNEWEKHRVIQGERFRDCTLQTNSDMGPAEIRQFYPLDETSTHLVKSAMQQMHLSARAYHRILKLARTIADLAGETDIRSPHIAEAIQYRPRRQV